MQDETIMAYGHFNRYDQYAGFITRDKSQKTLYLYLSDNEQKEYVRITNFCSGSNEYCSKDIVNVIPVDWDYNGYLDIIILADDSDNKGNKAFQAHFLLQNPADNILAQECNYDQCQLVNDVSTNIDSNQQPFLIPFQQQENHQHGLVYFSNDEQIRKFITYNSSSQSPSDKLILLDFMSLVDVQSPQCQKFSSTELASKQLAAVHFSSVVDLNGDCRDDLFIHSQDYDLQTGLIQDVFEFYIREESGLYCLIDVQKIPYHYTVQALGFTDANFDGGIDLVIVYLQKEDVAQKLVVAQSSIIQIAYNMIIPKSTCTSDYMFTSFYGDLTLMNQSQNNIFVMKYDFLLFNPSLRFGDLNLDGYNDMLMTVTLIGDIDQSPRSFFFENESCSSQCHYLSKNNRRFFQMQGSTTRYSLISKKKSISASFFDFNENGQLDIILNTLEEDGTYQTTSIYNYLKTDSYFVKVFVMNGFLDGSVGNDYTSSNIYGASVMCQVTTINEQVRPTKGLALYQSAHTPLQLPYVIMGISRTNSYVKDLVVGLGIKDGTTMSWNPIIPNTQINVFPSTNNSQDWTVAAFMVNVVQSLLDILIIAACLLISLGIAIYYLFAREKSIDKREIEIENLLI